MRVLEVKGRKRRFKNVGIVAAIRRMAIERTSWIGESFRLRFE
jgi:hypothetical protein